MFVFTSREVKFFRDLGSRRSQIRLSSLLMQRGVSVRQRLGAAGHTISRLVVLGDVCAQLVLNTVFSLFVRHALVQTPQGCLRGWARPKPSHVGHAQP